MPPVAQNPSPMVEYTRRHERLAEKTPAGQCYSLEGILDRPVEVYVPKNTTPPFDLLIHFHGAAFVARHAADQAPNPLITATANLGAGSAVYEKPFAQIDTLAHLLTAIEAQVGPWKHLWLSGFSAGYGALRAILSQQKYADQVDGILILDGLHTGYTPPHTPLAQKGTLEEGELAPFVAYAQRALTGDKAMLLIHSEVFPGTFASTTETADYLAQKLALQRQALLAWGPLGMQQLSQAQQGRLQLMGYAGNSAPDHMDHLHALPHFTTTLQDL